MIKVNIINKLILIGNYIYYLRIVNRYHYFSTNFLKQGQIKESLNGSLYLSDEGIIIAKGTLDIFPDLKKQKQEKQ